MITREGSLINRKRLNALTVAVVATALLLSVQAWLSTAFVIVSPGTTLDLSEAISVELLDSYIGTQDKVGDNGESSGHSGFLLTSVASERAGIIELLRLCTLPAAEIRPVKDEFPDGVSIQKYLQIMEGMMVESQLLAGVVALKEAGYPVEVSTQIKIEEVMRDGPAWGALEPGDTVVSVDRVEVRTTEDFMQNIRNRKVGDPVQLRVIRGGSPVETTLPTVRLPGEAETPGLRILVGAYHKSDLPVQIGFDCGPIKGSSAGLMFALQILSELQGRDLTGGRIIAGTGTIGLDGEVGPVQGLKQKMWAARASGAEYFLCPVENAKDLDGDVPPELTVIPVESFAGALRTLETL